MAVAQALLLVVDGGFAAVEFGGRVHEGLLLKGQHLALLKVCRRALNPDRASIDPDKLVYARSFCGNQRRHYLRRARHRQACVFVLAEKNSAALRLVQHSGTPAYPPDLLCRG